MISSAFEFCSNVGVNSQNGYLCWAHYKPWSTNSWLTSAGDGFNDNTEEIKVMAPQFSNYFQSPACYSRILKSVQIERALVVHLLGFFPSSTHCIINLYKQTAAITLHLRLSMFPRKQVAIYEDSFSAKGSWMASNVFCFVWEGRGQC